MSTEPVPTEPTDTEKRNQQPIDGVKTVVPADESPSAHCPYCGHPFATEELCALHLGERHRDDWTDEQRERYESAYDAESNQLFIFHLKVIGALVSIFFLFTYVYAFVWS